MKDERTEIEWLMIVFSYKVFPLFLLSSSSSHFARESLNSPNKTWLVKILVRLHNVLLHIYCWSKENFIARRAKEKSFFFAPLKHEPINVWLWSERKGKMETINWFICSDDGFTASSNFFCLLPPLNFYFIVSRGLKKIFI